MYSVFLNQLYTVLLKEVHKESLIVQSEEREIDLPTVIKSSYADGMVDFTESVRQLVEKEFIDMKIAYAYATNPEELKMALKGIRTGASSILG